MAKAKEMEYVQVNVIGVIGDAEKCHKSVEIGHYIVDGTEYANKVYIFDHYFNRDGSMGSKSIAKFTLDEAKEIGKLLTQVK